MKKILIILIITLSLIFIFYINENFCNIDTCKPYATLSINGTACCNKDNNAISFDESCNPTCKNVYDYYIKDKKCTPCYTKIVNNICCAELQGAESYKDDCSIETYKEVDEDTLSVYGSNDQKEFIMNVPGGDSTIKQTDRSILSYKSSDIWDEYIIYFNSEIKTRMEYKIGNITDKEIKKFRAISRKFVNFFSDDKKTDLIDQIKPDTLKTQDFVDKQIASTCVIELPPNMYLDNLSDSTFISVKNESNKPIDIIITTKNNNFRCILFKATNLNIYLDVNYKKLIKSIDVSNIQESNDVPKDVPEGIFYSANNQIKSINVPNGITVDFFKDTSNSEDSFIARLLGSQSQQIYYKNLNTKIEPVYKLIYYKTKKITEAGPDVDGEIYQNICYTNNKSCSKDLCCSETTNKCVNSVNVDNINNNGFCNISRVMYSGGYKILL